MARFRKEVDRIGTAPGAVTTIEYTYNARNNAFHDAIGKRTRELFDNFEKSYGRRAPRRTGRLVGGWKLRSRRIYKRGRVVRVSERTLTTDVPYERIVEAGGRGKRYAGTRRSGFRRRVFNTERRKLRSDVKGIVERIYGDR